MFKQIGFTLIELMIVVAIIGILAAVAIPGYQEYTLMTKRTDGQIGLMDMADKQERYYSGNNTYASDVASLFGAAGDQFSPKDFYKLTVTSGDSNGFVLTATAESEQTDDTGCTVMTYNQAGTKTPADCWN